MTCLKTSSFCGLPYFAEAIRLRSTHRYRTQSHSPLRTGPDSLRCHRRSRHPVLRQEPAESSSWYAAVLNVLPRWMTGESTCSARLACCARPASESQTANDAQLASEQEAPMGSRHHRSAARRQLPCTMGNGCSYQPRSTEQPVSSDTPGRSYVSCRTSINGPERRVNARWPEHYGNSRGAPVVTPETSRRQNDASGCLVRHSVLSSCRLQRGRQKTHSPRIFPFSQPLRRSRVLNNRRNGSQQLRWHSIFILHPSQHQAQRTQSTSTFYRPPGNETRPARTLRSTLSNTDECAGTSFVLGTTCGFESCCPPTTAEL